jgi:acyl-CoA reductase-like NAD-dependent aldehyde dehydrogenase
MLSAELEKASAKKVLNLKMFIDGDWCDAESGDTFEVRSPVTGEVIAVLPNASPKDVDRAVDAAKRSREKVRTMPVVERAKLMYKLVDAIMENREKYALDCTFEQGKSLRESYGEMDEVGPNILQQAEDMKRFAGEVYHPILKYNTKILTVHEPYGVFGVITPWNFPWLLPVECVPQAIMAGNTVVFKPAETTPISGLHLVECMERVGFPNGSINVVTGESGPIVGGRIVEHPDVNGVCFTGETKTGEEIVRRAGAKKVILEM